jgi:hypothetical protein
MRALIRTTKLPLSDQKILWRAVCAIERESFIGRLSEITGEPITRLMSRLPRLVTKQINRAVRSALNQAMELALYRFDSEFPEPALAVLTLASGATGGLAGFFGLTAVAIELPVTTALMLRSFAQIAGKCGEDLASPATRLACLEVFALGPRSARLGTSNETTYFAVRAFLAKTVGDAADLVAARGATQTSLPAVVEFVTAIGSRFGVVVSERAAAGAIPVVGAIGGAAVNLAFMTHFQKLASAHFAIRRLERQYGPREVVRMYEAYAGLMRK